MFQPNFERFLINISENHDFLNILRFIQILEKNSRSKNEDDCDGRKFACSSEIFEEPLLPIESDPSTQNEGWVSSKLCIVYNEYEQYKYSSCWCANWFVCNLWCCDTTRVSFFLSSLKYNVTLCCFSFFPPPINLLNFSFFFYKITNFYNL